MSIDMRTILLDIMSGKNINLTTNSNFLAWPEFQALWQTPQDPEWHAEGNVLIHTEMVLNECGSVAQSLNLQQRGLLYLSALFHDIAKPETTKYDAEIKHTIAPSHERIGGIRSRFMLRVLMEDISDEERRLVSQLVATHHLVKRAVKKFENDDSDAISYLERLAARVDTKLLWALEMADMRGRVCIDQAKQIEIVELFRMLCEENKVFGCTPKPWFSFDQIGDIPFADGFTAEYALDEMHRRRLLGWIKNEYQARAFLYEIARTKNKNQIAFVVFPIGISGSGKTAMYDNYFKDFVKISPDSQREIEFGDESCQEDHGKIYQNCTEQLKDVLRRGGRAYFDATNIIPDLRSKQVNICYDYGALVEFRVFDLPLEVLKKRNQERTRKVPEFVLDRQLFKFEWPLPEEYHKITVVNEYMRWW